MTYTINGKVYALPPNLQSTIDLALRAGILPRQPQAISVCSTLSLTENTIPANWIGHSSEHYAAIAAAIRRQ